MYYTTNTSKLRLAGPAAIGRRQALVNFRLPDFFECLVICLRETQQKIRLRRKYFEIWVICLRETQRKIHRESLFLLMHGFDYQQAGQVYFYCWPDLIERTI